MGRTIPSWKYDTENLLSANSGARHALVRPDTTFTKVLSNFHKASPATQNLNFYWKYRTVPNLHITHQRISPSNNNGNTSPTKRTRWCHNIVASCLYSSENALQIFKSIFIYRCWWGSNTLESNCHVDDQLTQPVTNNFHDHDDRSYFFVYIRTFPCDVNLYPRHTFPW